jgi:ATP-dependent RNA helicase DDX27
VQIKQIVKAAPVKRQTLLFSATMTEEVRQLAAVSLHKPVRLAADPSAAPPRDLLQEVIRLKVRLLCHCGWRRALEAPVMTV